MSTTTLKPDFESDIEARKNLLAILSEESRVIFPHEAAWLLGLSESAVYETVPRIQGLNTTKVRFDPKLIKRLKRGESLNGQSSLKIEGEEKSVELSKPIKRKMKVDICL